MNEEIIKAIEESKWLKEHDAEVIDEFVEYIKNDSRIKTVGVIFEEPCSYIRLGGHITHFADLLAKDFIKQLKKGNEE